MSGPKVIRIVTVDEILNLCAGELARVDAAIQEWTAFCERNDCLDAAAARTVTDRRIHLDRRLAAGQFIAIQKSAPALEQWLRDDQERRLTAAAEQHAEARSLRRRTAQLAQMILGEISAARVQVDASLLARLRASASGQPDDGAVREALTMMTGRLKSDAEVSTTVIERLKGDRPQPDWYEWIATRIPPQQTGHAALERQVSELALLDPASTWQAQFDDAVALADRIQRNLALDALSVQVSRELSAIRQVTALRSKAQAVVAELTVVDPEGAAVWPDQIAHAGRERLEAIVTTVTRRITARREAQAVETRRDAVLQQLANLGYQVTTDMSAAWVENGRLVIEKPATPGYGVEVSGGQAAGRIQVRAVALDADTAPDPARDHDAEVLWCTDVATMQAELQASGGALVIERATPVGAVPVKRVTAPERREGTRRVAGRPSQRRAH